MKLKFCVIGCGVIASGWHGPAYLRYQKTGAPIELAGCCDLDGDKADRYRAQFGFSRAYTDYETMLEKERPDAVSILVSENRMVQIAGNVLRRKIPCLLEKPPGLNLQDTDRLIHLAKQQQVLHQVAFNRRFMPLVLEIKDRLSSLGGPPGLQSANLEFVRHGRRDEDFTTTAIHGIDVIRFVLGDEFAHLRFSYQEMPELGNGVTNYFAEGESMKGVKVHLQFCPVAGNRYERIAVQSLDQTMDAYLPENTFTAGSSGKLSVYEQGQETVHIKKTACNESNQPEVLAGAYAENVDFFDSILNNRQPMVSLESCRESVAIMDSMRNRRKEYQFEGACLIN